MMDRFDVKGMIYGGMLFNRRRTSTGVQGLAFAKPAPQSVTAIPQSPFPSFVVVRPILPKASHRFPAVTCPSGPHFFQTQSAFAGFGHPEATHLENAFSSSASQPGTSLDGL